MKKTFSSLVVVAVGLAAAITLMFSIGPAQAARSSKPKEIVVVGSKVKEVVREAGLRSDGELVQALSEQVLLELRDAIRSAEANGRARLHFYDLTCWADLSRDELIVHGGMLKRLLGRRGFVADDDMIQAVSEKTRLMLEDAISRTRANGRSTVRPYDL